MTDNNDMIKFGSVIASPISYRHQQSTSDSIHNTQKDYWEEISKLIPPPCPLINNKYIDEESLKLRIVKPSISSLLLMKDMKKTCNGLKKKINKKINEVNISIGLPKHLRELENLYIYIYLDLIQLFMIVMGNYL